MTRRLLTAAFNRLMALLCRPYTKPDAGTVNLMRGLFND